MTLRDWELPPDAAASPLARAEADRPAAAVVKAQPDPETTSSYEIPQPGAAEDEKPVVAEPKPEAAPESTTPVERARELVARLQRNPVALLAGALVVVVGIFALFDRNTGALPGSHTQTHAAPSEFPAIEFKNVERSIVKQSEVSELLRRSLPVHSAPPVQTAPPSKPQVAASPPPTPRPKRARRARRRVVVAPEPPPEPEVEEEPQPRLGQFFAPGGVWEPKSKKKADKKKRLQLPVASRIPMVLDVGISSARHGTVLARTTAEVKTLDGVTMPKGTVITGRSSSGDERVYVDFSKVVVGGFAYSLTASATTNRQIGIPATRVETTLEDRAKDSLASDALQALQGVARIAGGPAGRAAGELGGGPIDEAQRDLQVDRSFRLEVAAGTRFEVVITAP